MGGLIEMEQKGCQSIIHDHDCDVWVTLVGWVDVPYSDWGDFRPQRAVEISSYFLYIKDKYLEYFLWHSIAFSWRLQYLTDN